MNTIKEGSTGSDVEIWQKTIGVTADGKFGPNTQSKTIEWQKAHKLVPDGVVGPATWAAALGTKMPKVTEKTPQANVDAEAYEIAKKADPTLTEKERQYVLAVARGEGFYGRGWSTPSAATLAKSKELGLTGYEGVGSNNWGAVQGTGNAGSFPHLDYHADGTPYVGKFRKYATPEDGFNHMAKTILGGGMRKEQGAQEIKTAINKGSLKEAVYAQHANKYFELAPDKYLSAVLKNYDILSVNTDWKKLMSEKGGVVANLLGKLGIVILVLTGAGAALFTAHKLRG